MGIYAIVEVLTREGIPCPSAHDPARNRHRCGIAWNKFAVRAILVNSRYTGHQVWNRQRKDEVLLDVDDVALGHTSKLRSNETGKWVWSEQIEHPPIIDREPFDQVQSLLGGRASVPAEHKPHRARRPYALRGCLWCGICEQRMQSHWANSAPYYRCWFPAEYALADRIEHPLKSACERTPSLPRSMAGWPESSPRTACARPSPTWPQPRRSMPRMRRDRRSLRVTASWPSTARRWMPERLSKLQQEAQEVWGPPGSRAELDQPSSARSAT